MWDHLDRLHKGFLQEVPEQTLIMKIAEEFGEAVQAHIGVTGQNPRKGFYGSRGDVLEELADVIITTGIAMISVADGDPEKAAARLRERLEAVTVRAGLQAV